MPKKQKAQVFIVDDDEPLRGLLRANVNCYVHAEHAVSIYMAESVPDFRSQLEGVVTWVGAEEVDHVILITDYQLGNGGTAMHTIADLYEVLPDNYHDKVTIALASGLPLSDSAIGAVLLRYTQVRYIQKPKDLAMLRELLKELNLHRDIPVS